MKMKDLILKNIYKSIKEVNESLDTKILLDKAIETTLFGKTGTLDSLGLINLIVSVEQNIEEEFDFTISLANDRALSQKHSPFSTIKSLADYIEILLNEKSND